MRRLAWVVALLLGLILPFGGPLPALAQGQVEIKAPPPERPPRPEFIIPGQPPELTLLREQEFYPDRIRSRHDPAFIVPFSTTVSTGPRTVGRFGLSLWTAPQGRGGPRDGGLARVRLQLRVGHSRRERDGPLAGVPAPSFPILRSLRLPVRIL